MQSKVKQNILSQSSSLFSDKTIFNVIKAILKDLFKVSKFPGVLIDNSLQIALSLF